MEQEGRLCQQSTPPLPPFRIPNSARVGSESPLKPEERGGVPPNPSLSQADGASLLPLVIVVFFVQEVGEASPSPPLSVVPTTKKELPPRFSLRDRFFGWVIPPSLHLFAAPPMTPLGPFSSPLFDRP